MGGDGACVLGLTGADWLFLNIRGEDEEEVGDSVVDRDDVDSDMSGELLSLGAGNTSDGVDCRPRVSRTLIEGLR